MEMFRLPRVATYAVFLLAIFLSANLSIYLTRLGGGLAIIWLPNALCVAYFIARRVTQPWPFLALHALGIACANLVFGDPVALAVKLGLANMGATFLLGQLYLRVLTETARPHNGDVTYRRFLIRVALPSSLVGALLGGWAVSQQYGLPYLSVFFNWAIGDAVSAIVFLPLFLLVLDRSPRRWFGQVDLLWIALFGALLAATTVASHLVGDDPVLPLALAGPILAVAAAFVQTRGVILLTALHLLGLFVGTLLDQDYLSRRFPDVETLVILAAIFLCVAVPANLIASMVAHLQEARRVAEHAMHVKERFLSTMSHELRTPLNAISGMYQLLMTLDLAPRHQSWVRAGLDSTKVLDRLVGDLFLSAIGQEKSIQIDLRPEPVEAFIQQAHHTLEAEIQASGKPLKIKLHQAPFLPETFMADWLRINQVMTNLISNAVKYSKSGDIELAFFASEGQFSISVRDQGQGIAELDLPHVFDRFWQADTGAARRHDGAGLGLYIARELTQAMGGTLNVQSTLGQGSQFTLTLRSVAAEPGKDAGQLAADQSVPAPSVAV